MRKEIVRCDVCGKTAEITSHLKELPPDWMTYSISPDLHCYHVCPECAKKMLTSVV